MKFKKNLTKEVFIQAKIPGKANRTTFEYWKFSKKNTKKQLNIDSFQETIVDRREFSMENS